MAEAERLIFDESERSNVNLAIQQITDRIYNYALDSRGNRIWQKVGRGIGLPGEFIKEYEAPAILIYDSLDMHAAQIPMVDSEIVTNVSLYCYLYVLESETGTWADVQTLRRNMTRATTRALWPSDINHVGLDPDGKRWRLDPQMIMVDYGDVLRNKFPEYTITPPWYVWKIDLEVWSWNVY